MENNAYETIFVLSPALGEEDTAALTDKFKQLIEQNGEIGTVDLWGKRRLAYEIQDFTEGYYVRIEFKSPAEFPRELDRIYKITDGVLRSLIVRV